MSNRGLSAKFVNWDKVPHFGKKEFGTHLQELDSILLYALGSFRSLLNAPVFISPSNWGSHVPNSYHSAKKGRNAFGWALDVFPSGSLLFAYQTALSIKEFGGVGVYPFWSYPSKKLQGGLHLDIRLYPTNKSLWFYNSVAGKGQYKSLHSVEDCLDMFELLSTIGDQK